MGILGDFVPARALLGPRVLASLLGPRTCVATRGSDETGADRAESLGRPAMWASRR